MAFAANDDDSWKQKYQNHVDETESNENQWKQDEALLKHSLIRVALAADGIDQDLDRQLKKLRKLLRHEDNYDKLKNAVDSICTTVKGLNQSSGQNSSTVDTLCCLVDNVALPKKHQKNANQLVEQLTRSDSPTLSKTVLKSYSAIVNDALLSLQGDSTSWLQRVFGASDDIHIDYSSADTDPNEEDVSEEKYSRVGSELLEQLINKLPSHWLDVKQSQQLREQVNRLETKQAISTLLDDIVQSLQAVTESITPSAVQTSCTSSPEDNCQLIIVNQFCLKLLETLNFPQDLQPAATALRDRIVDGITEAEIPGILKAISDLVITIRNRIETEKKDLQEFLLQLTGHLNDIDVDLSNMANMSIKSSHSDKKFGQKISQELESLSKSIQNADSIESLEKAAQDRIQVIQTHLSKNQNTLIERQHKFEKALNKSSARLKKLEQEGDNLRDRLQQEHARETLDALTGLQNRLAYEEHIHMEYARWERYQKPLSMLIFDIDHFKNINDSYSHKAGDKALRLIAKKLISNMRETDIVARYGGQEFIVLMPETTIEDAMMAAEKLRQRVAEVEFNFHNKLIPITISCGGTEFISGDSIDTAFERADQALFQAKKLGRNRCYTCQNAA